MTAESATTPQTDGETVRRNRLGRLALFTVIPLATAMAFALTWVGVDPTLTPPQRQARADIRRMEGFLKSYFRITGRYPTQAEGIYPLLQAGLLREVPYDPWGRPYVYYVKGKSGYVLSRGADGLPGGEGEDADVTGSGPTWEVLP
jgi:general secretion pathway protein G